MPANQKLSTLLLCSKACAAFFLIFLSPMIVIYSSSSIHPITKELTRYKFSNSLLDLWLLCSMFAVLSSAHGFVRIKFTIQFLLHAVSAAGAVTLCIVKGLYSDRLRERRVLFSYLWISLWTFLIIALNMTKSVRDVFFSPSNSIENKPFVADLEAPLLQEESKVLLEPQTETSSATKEKASVARLLRLAKSEVCLTIYAVIALAVSSTCSLAQPYFFGLMINSSSLGAAAVTKPDDAHVTRQQRLNTYAIVLVIIFFVGGITSAIRGYLFNLIGERLVRNLRRQLFEAILSQDVAFFDRNKTGELVSRLSTDTVAIQSCLSVNVSMGLRSVAQVLVSIVLLFLTSWSLTLVMLAVVPLLVAVAVVWGRYTKDLSKDYQDSLAKAADIGSETISNIRIVKAFGSEKLESQAYAGAVGNAYSKGAKKAVYYGVFVGALMFLSNASILLVIYYGASLVIRGHMSVGDLTAFVLYSIYITIGLASCTDLYSELMSALGASERIFRILDMKPSIPLKGGIWPDYSAPELETTFPAFVTSKGEVNRDDSALQTRASSVRLNHSSEKKSSDDREEERLHDFEAATAIAGTVSVSQDTDTVSPMHRIGLRHQPNSTARRPRLHHNEPAHTSVLTTISDAAAAKIVTDLTATETEPRPSYSTTSTHRLADTAATPPAQAPAATPSSSSSNHHRGRGGGGGSGSGGGGAVIFKDVEFRYPARPDVEVLKGFNLDIAARQTVALVGASGSGKSTALSLLERFYDTTGGSILIDGVDIRLLDPRWLHRTIAIVPQEPVLFSGTIRENISYARRAASFDTPEMPSRRGFKDNTAVDPNAAAAARVVASASSSSTSSSSANRRRPQHQHNGTPVKLEEHELSITEDKKRDQLHKQQGQQYFPTSNTTSNASAFLPSSSSSSSSTPSPSLPSLYIDEEEADLIEAAKKAYAHDFIMKLPEGYDTIVGERGVRLSGGQKQRVAIARALLADPMILLLDEATSALDSESEQLVQRAIDSLMHDRTVIVIAHRLSTVRDADIIAVCQDGRVVDADTHDALMQRCEVYRNLVSRQLQWGRKNSSSAEKTDGSEELPLPGASCTYTALSLPLSPEVPLSPAGVTKDGSVIHEMLVDSALGCNNTKNSVGKTDTPVPGAWDSRSSAATAAAGGGCQAVPPGNQAEESSRNGSYGYADNDNWLVEEFRPPVNLSTIGFDP